ncbi:MAG TPA: YafY family protein [Symbiobacteriaceae bacterium]|nr:YafY family protein [Symbiobacteriaceae bacterium]
MAKADNLLAVLWLLKQRHRMTAADIAAELETSVRTVYRYIDSLCASGVPVVAEAGPEGGYYLAENFKGAPLFFDAAELVALFAAARFAQSSGHPYQAALEGALTKVRHNLAPHQQAELERHTAGLLVAQGLRHPGAGQWLGDLERAVAACTTVELTYQKPEDEEPRVRQVDPYGLSYQAGLWILAAYCHSRRALRNFRVDRIQALRPTGARFERPAEFRLEEHFAADSGDIGRQIQAGPHTKVLITGAPHALASLCEHWYLRHCLVRRAPREAEFAVDPVGMTHLPGHLFPFGRDITVQEPASLRQALAEMARRLLAHHEETP